MISKKRLSGLPPLFVAHFLPHLFSKGASIKGQKILSEFKGKKVLDAGSGCGWLSRLSLEKKFQVTSVDLSDKVIKLEKEFSKLSGLPALKIKKASILKLPFKDKSFDTVVCSEVLEHLDPPLVLKALKEFNRVLKDDGVLVITVPGFFYGLVYDFILAGTIQKNKSSRFSYLSFLNTQLPKSAKIKLKFEEEDSHKQQFSKGKMQKLFNSAGLKMVKSENLEVFTPLLRSVSNLFVFTREKFGKLEEYDSLFSKFAPLFIGSDWLFVGKKNKK